MKRYLTLNVVDAAKDRINRVFDHFAYYFVSFSGGKDSGIMLQLIIDVARERGRLPVPVLFYDWEAIYQNTDQFVRRMLASPDIEPTWVCLPVTERNGSSNYQPFWRPWHDKDRALWVRDIPDLPYVIHEGNLPADWRDWYEPDNHDQHFFIRYADWWAKSRGADKVANFIGIRVSESHDRYKMLKTQKNRIKYQGWDWIYRYKQNEQELYYTMPIYDMGTQDVWTAVAQNGYDYNRIYDDMYQLGVPLHDMRVCNPYGEQQRRGLHQYHELEPDTWFRVVNRVSGANFGAFYNKSKLMAGAIPKPDHVSWHQYLDVLLGSLPDHTRFHYQRNFETALAWHRNREPLLGRTLVFDARTDIPWADIDAGTLRINDVMSYQLLVETVVKGDYWCKKLYFAETKREKGRQNELIETYDHDD